MPSFYIDIDNNGNEIRKPKGRGPTLNGYAEVEPGIFRRIGDGKTTNSYELYYLIFNEGGSYASHKPISRGRRPANSVRIKVSEGKYSLCDGESFPANADLDTLPTSFFEAEGGISTFIEVEDPISAKELASMIKCIKQEKHGKWMSFKGCDFIGEPSIEYFRKNPTHSRIDFDLSNGDVKVWHMVYTPNKPDVVLRNAVIVEETVNV